MILTGAGKSHDFHGDIVFESSVFNIFTVYMKSVL